MEPTSQPRHSSRVWLNAAALVVVIAGLKAAKSLVVLALFAGFISIISAPLMIWLRKRKVPSVIAVSAVVLLLLGALAIAGGLIGTSISSFIRALPMYRERLNEQVESLLVWLYNRGLAEDVLQELNTIETGDVISLVGNTFTAVGTLVTNSFVVILLVSFILLEISGFEQKLQSAFGVSTQSVERFREIAGNVERYLGLKTIICAATGLGIGIWVAALGLDYAVLWGTLAFVLNYIPTIGSVVAAIPAVILALVQFGVGKAVIVLLGYLLVNLVMGNVVEPRVMGRHLGLSPLVVFVSLLAWGWILGMIGMFLAVPLTMATKIALQSSPETRWLATLMGPEPKHPPEETAEDAPADGDPTPESQENVTTAPR